MPFLRHSLLLLDTGLSLAWSLLSGLCWLATEPQGSSCLSSSKCWDYKHVTVPGLFTWGLGVKLRSSCIHTVSTLPTKLSLQPSLDFFIILHVLREGLLCLALNSQKFACIRHLSSGITGVCHHAWLLFGILK